MGAGNLGRVPVGGGSGKRPQRVEHEGLRGKGAEITGHGECGGSHGKGMRRSPAKEGDAKANAVRPRGSLGGTDACRWPHGGSRGSRAESAAGKPSGGRKQPVEGPGYGMGAAGEAASAPGTAYPRLSLSRRARAVQSWSLRSKPLGKLRHEGRRRAPRLPCPAPPRARAGMIQSQTPSRSQIILRKRAGGWQWRSSELDTPSCPRGLRRVPVLVPRVPPVPGGAGPSTGASAALFPQVVFIPAWIGAGPAGGTLNFPLHPSPSCFTLPK